MDRSNMSLFLQRLLHRFSLHIIYVWLPKVEEAIDFVATHLAEFYVVLATITIGGLTRPPAQIGNDKYRMPSHELLQFEFVASWQTFRDTVRE
jgi:hypothetical protein